MNYTAAPQVAWSRDQWNYIFEIQIHIHLQSRILCSIVSFRTSNKTELFVCSEVEIFFN